ncbi:class I SAM-dependent methyltransferase [Neisseria bacilliformis]|uniref:class I SAM-dependent methyltransferase n=1 Tax=Neisseria bacilliformis TaxID=267212 RepID=UPI0006669CB3|nr:SAM-dependent methyltransferase [Neisseria bacilliformis]
MNHQHLPEPDPQALAASQKLEQIIQNEIKASSAPIPFSRFMELALYAPQYGYYTGGAHKIGAAGDFVTAPALTPLFGQTLARQIGELLPQTAGGICEFGAGTGELAATLLDSLRGTALDAYFIIEVSPELAERQRAHIAARVPDMAHKVRHLAALPDAFDGIIIGNEVLDAIPCELVRREGGRFWRICVGTENGAFVQIPRPLADPQLLRLAQQYFPDAEPYTSELHPVQHAFVRTLADRLQRGAIILIDYGFDAAQYYHPQRHMGTLIGHYCHHTVHDPFFRVGLTDLTAHVNFTDTAQAGTDGGLDLIGYATQADFLLNLGITELAGNGLPHDSPAYIQTACALHKLLMPHEMGELFKVIAFGRNIGIDWQGFAHGDICHKL